MRQVQRDDCERRGQTSAEKVRINELAREVRELGQANEILKRHRILPRRSSTARFANDCFH